MALLLLLTLLVQALGQYDLYDQLRPADTCIDRQENCDKWAKLMPSQCIYNAHYMRSNCQKSCEVVPVCNDVPRHDTWKGQATSGGTSKYQGIIERS